MSETSSPVPRIILVGLIGAGIQPSRSPALHMAEGAANGLAYVYRLIDLESPGLAVPLAELVAWARHFGFTGLNITHPCKQAIIPLLDTLSDDARAVGAVNTVVFTDGGKAVGHNTDWSGFAEGFRRELAGQRRDLVVQLGAGGAGAAVGYALLTLGVRQLTIFDTDEKRATHLAERLTTQFGPGRVAVVDDPQQPVATADGLVNTTPIGMAGHPGMPVSAALLRRDLWVADVVYFPLETGLLRAARATGCRTMAGGLMAVFQAAAAFRLFTGIEPDADRMLRHFASM
ncbi:MAG: shikimate dehydrogenase, partial [Acetobacteraceae bacterium]